MSEEEKTDAAEADDTYPGYDRAVAERNVKARMAIIGVTIADIADVLGVTRPAVYRRIKRMAPVDVAWFSIVLVVPEPFLLEQNPVHAAAPPVPPPDWIERIKHMLGTEVSFETVRLAAFGTWQQFTPGEK